MCSVILLLITGTSGGGVDNLVVVHNVCYTWEDQDKEEGTSRTATDDEDEDGDDDRVLLQVLFLVFFVFFWAARATGHATASPVQSSYIV